MPPSIPSAKPEKFLAIMLGPPDAGHHGLGDLIVPTRKLLAPGAARES
jgi:hypothetical protein